MKLDKIVPASFTETEQGLMLSLLRRFVSPSGSLGLSSMQLIVSTLTGDPVKRHPYDAGDVRGLTETLDQLPAELRAKAQPIYDEQIRLYEQMQEHFAAQEALEA